MNKIQMEDTARMLVSIAEDILINIEDADFAEVRELITKLSSAIEALKQEVGR